MTTFLFIYILVSFLIGMGLFPFFLLVFDYFEPNWIQVSGAMLLLCLIGGPLMIVSFIICGIFVFGSELYDKTERFLYERKYNKEVKRTPLTDD